MLAIPMMVSLAGACSAAEQERIDRAGMIVAVIVLGVAFVWLCFSLGLAMVAARAALRSPRPLTVWSAFGAAVPAALTASILGTVGWTVASEADSSHALWWGGAVFALAASATALVAAHRGASRASIRSPLAHWAAAVALVFLLAFGGLVFAAFQ
jgi:drug/metabolite transporter (DMT)-like permease